MKQISKAVEQDDFRAITLVSEIVKSYPFQYRRSNETELAKNESDQKAVH